MSRCLHFLLLLALLCLAASAGAQGVPAAAVPPPAIAAKAYLLVDVLSGQTLPAQNADERRAPASLTKQMPAYLVVRALKERDLVPSQVVTLSTMASRAAGAGIFTEP